VYLHTNIVVSNKSYVSAYACGTTNIYISPHTRVSTNEFVSTNTSAFKTRLYLLNMFIEFLLGTM